MVDGYRVPFSPSSGACDARYGIGAASAVQLRGDRGTDSRRSPVARDEAAPGARTGRPRPALRPDVCRRRPALDPAGATAARLVAPGAVHDPERTPVDGTTRVQSAL